MLEMIVKAYRDGIDVRIIIKFLIDEVKGYLLTDSKGVVWSEEDEMV